MTKKQLGEIETTVEASEKSSLVVEEMFGYLWPLELYRKRFASEGEPDKSLVTEVVHKGKVVRGILKSPDEGWAPGVLKVYEETKASVARNKVLEDSNFAIRDKQLQDSFAFHQEQLHVEVKSTGTDNEEDGSNRGPITLKRKLQMPKDDDGDDDDAGFCTRFASGRIIGASVSAPCKAASRSKGSNSKDSGGKEPKAAAPRAPKRPASEALSITGSEEAPSSGGKKARQQGSVMKREQERCLVDLAMLEAEQVLKLSAGAMGSMKSLPPNKVAAAIKKLEARLQHKNVEVWVYKFAWELQGPDSSEVVFYVTLPVRSSVTRESLAPRSSRCASAWSIGP